MVIPAITSKIAAVVSALILVPTTTFFIHHYVKNGSFKMQNNALLEGPYRLPLDVVPIRYEIDIRTDFSKKFFAGFVRIEIECKKPTSTVIIHARQLILMDGIKFFASSDKKGIKVDKMDYSNIPSENPNDLLILHLSEELKTNTRYHFEIDFGGTYSMWENGFYLSSDQEGHNVATTHLLPVGARKAFPCFDEPDLKAEFIIKLGCNNGLQAISNMSPSGTNRDNGGFLWQNFEKSPLISPHQVGIIIGHLVFRTDSKAAGGFTLTTWTLPAKIGKAAFIRTIGLNVINFYEKFFDFSYPLNHLNLVVLPEVADQVKESYGLITLSETQLLMESTASPSSKYHAALVYSHELSHQWMGCLATMKWWSDYWIMESFAFFIRSLPIKEHFTEWNSVAIELGMSLVNVLIIDDKNKATPLNIPDAKGKRAEQLLGFGDYEDYRDITVNKGAMLFHMLYNSLGEDVFKAGVSAYLKKFAFKVSEQDDLWAAFDEAAQNKQVLPSGVTVKQILEKWIKQAGYPVLEVKRNGGQFTITQKRFLVSASSKPEDAKQCWWVPVKSYSASKPKAATGGAQWLGCEPNSLTIDTGARAGDWVLLNRETGVFRVNYDSQTWDQLATALQGTNRQTISEVDRVLLVSDAMELAISGDVSYTNALKVLSSVSQEEQYLPWYSALNHLQELEERLMRTDKYDSFKKMIKKLLANIYSVLEKKSVGLDDDKLRKMILAWACKYDVGDCAQDLMKQFAKWKVDKKMTMEKDQRFLVVCEGVKQGGEDVWNEIWKYSLEAPINVKSTILMALSCTTHQESFNKLLSSSLDKDVSPAIFSVVGYLEGFRNREGYPLILNYVLNNFEKVKKFFSVNYLTMIFETFGQLAAKQDDIDKLKKFASENKEMADQLHMTHVLENAEQRVAWLKKNLDSITAAMDAF